jgi:hypothetical protein
MLWTDLICSLREFLLDFLWVQLSSIGVPGAAKARKAWIADPEAYVVAGLDLGRYDARLFDAIASWILVHGNLLDSKRLRDLVLQAPPDVRSATAALAEVFGSKGKPVKWAALADAGTRGEKVSLFRRQDGAREKAFGKRDPVFQRHGLLRHPLEWRSDTGALPRSGWGGLRLRMRAVTGIGLRAEILSVLLTVGRIHPRGLAALVDAAPRSVSEIMREMSGAGVLDQRSEGRKILYSIRKAEALASLIDVEWGSAPPWIDWPRLLSGLCDLARLPEDDGFRSASEAAKRSRVLDKWEGLATVLRTGVLDGSAPDRVSDVEEQSFDRFVITLRNRLLS